MTVIDLRSDTVTQPPPAMRDAMARAPLGDDVYGEDPSVNDLEARAAVLLGKQAGLFVPSGVMGNLLAVLAHCRRGDEVIVGDRSHMYLNEGGGPSVLGGTTARPVATSPSGELAVEALAAAVRTDNIHHPRTGLICLENTHNFAGGMVLGPAYMADVAALAAGQGVPLHLDGARLFNAAVSLGLPVADLAAPATSVMVCFSKGLAAPVGSLLAGPAPFIAAARRWRKQLGGGMRQAGVLAAGCLYALDHMVDRLAEDHAHARALAEGLATMPGVVLAQPSVPTAIVIVDVAGVGTPVPILLGKLAGAGVLASAVGPTAIRFVTHWGVTADDVGRALAGIKRAFAPA